MSSPGKRFSPVILAGLLLLAGRPTFAQQEDEGDGFRLHLDQGKLGAFFSDVDTGSSKFEEYRDVSDGVVSKLRLSGESADGNRYLEFLATNIQREDERYTLDYGVAGSWAMSFDFNAIPHRFGNDGTLLHNMTGPGRLEISDSTQAYLQGLNEDQRAVDPAGVNYNFLNGNIDPFVVAADSVDLELKRSRTNAEFRLGNLKGMKFIGDLGYESRKGTRPYGGSFGFSNIVEIPEPIDYDTLNLGVKGEWAGETAGVVFGYRYSDFTNHIDTVLYDNPWRATDSTDPSAYTSPGSNSVGGPATARNTLSPDNNANNIYASGRARFGEKGWVNGQLSWNQMKQDDPLAAYSTNTAINAGSGAPFDVTDEANLPVASFAGESDVLDLTAGAGTRFGGADVAFRFKRYDYDNQSERIEFPGYARFDAVWEEIGRISVPFSYTRTDVGGEFGYRFTGSTRVGVVYNHQFYDREFREVDSAGEDTLKLTLDTRAGRKMMLHASYTWGDRSIDDYVTEAQLYSFTDPEDINNQPGLRKFDQAGRRYHQGAVRATFLLGEQVDIGVSFSGRDDDYNDCDAIGEDCPPDENELGLKSDRIWNLHFDFGWSPREDVTVFAFGGRADRESFMIGRQSGGTVSLDPANNWELTLGEVTDTVGAGFDATLTGRWSGSANFQWNQADGDTDFFSPPGGTPNLALGYPEYDDNELVAFYGKLGFAFSPRIKAQFGYGYEDYTVDRFAREGVQPYLPGSLILAADDGDYQGHLVFLGLDANF